MVTIPFSTERARRYVSGLPLPDDLVTVPEVFWDDHAVAGQITREDLVTAFRLMPERHPPPIQFFDVSAVNRPADRVAFRP